MANNTWKSVERRIAEKLGGERVPVSGRTGEAGMESPDIEHALWSLEIKHRDQRSMPKWIEHSYDQALASMKEHHIAPVCILHTKNRRLDNAVVTMPLSYFLKIQTLLGETAAATTTNGLD